MKPLEILSALPKWSTAKPDQILASPAFAFPCRLGEEAAVLRLGAVQGGDTLDLSILFGDEPHELRLSRSPRFPELDKVWDGRAEMPEPILLALVEKECGAFFQMLENAVRRQLRLTGLSTATGSGERVLFAQASDIVFAISRSDTVAGAFGMLRYLDMSHAELRSETLPFHAEYAVFALSAADVTSLAVGDALLLPEVGTVSPRLIVDRRFVVSETGVDPFSDDGRCRIVSGERNPMTLGELFDAAEGREIPKLKDVALSPDGAPPVQLRAVQNGKPIAFGHLGRLGDQSAFIVESLST